MEKMEKIYLNQLNEDGEDLDGYDEITWCEDDVHGNGTPYILEEKYLALEARNTALLVGCRWALEQIPNLTVEQRRELKRLIKGGEES